MLAQSFQIATQTLLRLPQGIAIGVIQAGRIDRLQSPGLLDLALQRGEQRTVALLRLEAGGGARSRS
jgi:hypothetical protein